MTLVDVQDSFLASSFMLALNFVKKRSFQTENY